MYVGEDGKVFKHVIDKVCCHSILILVLLAVTLTQSFQVIPDQNREPVTAPVTNMVAPKLALFIGLTTNDWTHLLF